MMEMEMKASHDCLNTFDNSIGGVFRRAVSEVRLCIKDKVVLDVGCFILRLTTGLVSPGRVSHVRWRTNNI